MKAHVAITQGPASEVFQIIDLPIPHPQAEDVLIKVHYTSVNPLDCKIRMQPSNKRNFPIILGFDVCGEIVAVGDKVIDLEVGTMVMASPSPFRSGANAEYVLVESRNCVAIGSLDHTLAAALPLAGITAYEALFYRLKVREGDTLLIHAGAGGVGHMALQLAKAVGCTVITTASRQESLMFCKKTCGADHVIDYKSSNLKEFISEITQGQGLSYIFDTVGGTTFTESLSCLASNGHICTILPVHFDATTAYANLLKNITISYEFMGSTYPLEPYRQRTVLDHLKKHLANGTLLPHISRVYSFEDLPLAHLELEQGHTIGKILVKVRS